jgi:hypothetical protein
VIELKPANCSESRGEIDLNIEALMHGDQHSLQAVASGGWLVAANY